MWNLVNPPWKTRKTKKRPPHEGSVSNLGGMLQFALDDNIRRNGLQPWSMAPFVRIVVGWTIERAKNDEVAKSSESVTNFKKY
jgi:hypothetical protein